MPWTATPSAQSCQTGYDNLLLAQPDSSRVMTDETRRRVCVGDLVRHTVLVDGTVRGAWHLDRARGVVTIEPFAGSHPPSTTR